jgi:hypothetical protein
MTVASLERWIWILVYGGLLMLCLGLFVRAADAALATVMMVTGGVAAAAGVGLIFVRSRRRD